MTHWLDPVRRTLDLRETPVTVFFRDDDAGWDDDALERLMDLFEDAGLPLDLAVIPTALSAERARDLRARVAGGTGLGVHQHGWSHANHETVGRKCEFGDSRSRARQFEDIAQGRQLIRTRLGDAVAPIFTPPWNRCTRDTAECLVLLGFTTLSRDLTAGTFDVDGLAELPVTVDWFAKSHGSRLDLPELGRLIASALRSASAPVGLMFHHAVMSARDVGSTGELLGLLARHDAIRARSMADCARQPRPAAAVSTR